jgi:multisubunit Na+/H+ antiporter MnhF subunit
VSAFVVAAIVMLAGMIPCGIMVWRGTAMEALAGYEAIGSIAVMVLILLAEGFNRFGELELPIVLAVLLFGSGLVFARAMERWL